MLDDDKLSKWIEQTVQSGDIPRKIVLQKIAKTLKKKKPYKKKKGFKYKGNGPQTRASLKIIPLGGCEEVGKNMTLFEYGNDIIILDMGFQFPEEDMLGVDYVIPDTSYLEGKEKNIKGVIITHGHLDHTGGIPYLVDQLGTPPFYGTKLTMGMVKKRLEEFDLSKKPRLNTINYNDTIKLGPFKVNFFHVSHSIPAGVGVVIETPQGILVHTGDFKFDFTPADEHPVDLSKIAELSQKNVIALFSDSTNAMKPGYTVSEKYIGETLDKVIKEADGRVIIASFSSLISRIQQIVNSAVKYKKKVFVSGRSMIDNIKIATELGYLKIPQGLVQKITKKTKLDSKDALILTTGSQGEAVSALTRISLNEHSQVKIKKGDTVVFSSSPIIGNEKAIKTVMNNLCRLGAKVISNQIMDVHTSGHACQEDLKLMITLVKPKYLVPVHGELYMRIAHKEVAESLGMPSENIFLMDNGDILEIYKGRMTKAKKPLDTSYILVDGLGVGDVGSQVIMDRQTMADNGVLLVIVPINKRNRKLKGKIDVISRGFMYAAEAEIVKEIAKISEEAYKTILKKNPKAKRGLVKKFITGKVDKFVHKKLERRPMILPIIIEQ